MKLRPIVETDAELLFDIRCSVAENHQSREELAELDITVESVRAMICSGDYVGYLAELDGCEAGFALANIPQGYVLACFVRPSCENRGVGRAVLERTELALREAGVRAVWLSTGSVDGLRAIGFYERLGWRRNGVLEDGQIRFEKKLL